MRLPLIPGLALSLLLGSCVSNGSKSNNPQPSVLTQYRPVLMSRTQLESAVAGLPPRALQVPGKIFAGNRYLFVNEQYQGIHVFDNADPAHPAAVAFLRIPGNLDLAVRGTLLYADNGPDLLTLDISDPTRMQVLSRTRDALPEVQPPLRNLVLPTQYQPANRPAGSVVVGWEKVKP